MMEDENTDNKEISDEEETDSCMMDDPQFVNHQNSVFRLRKQRKGNLSTSNNYMSPEERSNWEKEKLERELKLKAIKTERLLEAIKSNKNQISMWQSFPANGDDRAVVFCYEREYLKAWMNLNAVSFENNYHLILTDMEIKLTTEKNQNCCKKNTQGVSHTGITRTYRVPRPLDYHRAVWHQVGNNIEICVPWCQPLA